jgi:hypothetical protein
MTESVLYGLFDVIHTTAADVLMTVIHLDQATFKRDPSAVRLHTELNAQLWILAEAIDALPPEAIRAKPNLRLAELARLPGLLERPDVEPSVRLLRRTLEAPMRAILREIPRQARVPKGY